MNYSSCGRENRADTVFCDQCGSRQSLTCPRCQRTLAVDARFCDGCGAQLETTRAADSRIQELLDAAEDLTTKTGARLYQPILDQERADLLLQRNIRAGARALLKSAAEGLEALGAGLNARSVRTRLDELL